MTTRKFSTFEYTLDAFEGKGGQDGYFQQDAFETPHGHAFVIAGAAQAGLASTAVERIRYYFENEPDDKPDDICRNALIYTGGFLYQQGQNDPERTPEDVSCICVLFDGENIHYSSAGNFCMSVLSGRRIHSLLAADSEISGRGFLGEAAVTEPESSHRPSTPGQNDILLIAAGAVCEHLSQKQLRKTLLDSMPLQTKLSRIIGLARDEGAGLPAAACMLCFYGAGQGKAVYWMGDNQIKEDSSKRVKRKDMGSKNAFGPVKVSAALRYAIMALVFVFVAYMFYDLFIYNPKPPVSVPVSQMADPRADTLIEEPDDPYDPDMPPPLPDDIAYTVRGGDTWNRIFLQYRVCSWFIINHPPNTGRLGRDGGLIAGQRLQIPVRYSGDPDLNPYYYTEFTLDQVGSSCENAGREFLEEFSERYSAAGQ